MTKKKELIIVNIEVICLYCEHCGKKIDEDSIFCTYCGEKVKKEEKKPQKTEERKKKTEPKILLMIILILLFGFIFYHELTYFNSAENAIHQYLKDWKNKNYDSILNTLNIESTDFTSKTMLIKSLKEKKELQMFDYQIHSCDYETDKKEAKCYITYQTESNGITYEKVYQLERQEKNRLWIFAEWKVKNKEIEILEDWTIYLPKDSIAELEQVDLTPYRNIEKDKDGFEAYTIDKIFKGNYELNLKLNTGMILNSHIKIKNSEYNYQFNMQDISEEYKNEIKKIGEELISEIYTGIIEKKEFKDLSSNYDIDPIKSNYEKVKKEIEQEITLTKFSLNEIKVTNVKIEENGNLICTYQMNYQYTFQYKKEGKDLEHTGESNDTFYITMKDANLSEIEKIESLVTYFSKKY